MEKEHEDECRKRMDAENRTGKSDNEISDSITMWHEVGTYDEKGGQINGMMSWSRCEKKI